MPENERTARLEAAAYEIGQAKAVADRWMVNQNLTAYRRGLAACMVALGYSILVLIDKWIALDGQMYGKPGDGAE